MGSDPKPPVIPTLLTILLFRLIMLVMGLKTVPRNAQKIKVFMFKNKKFAPPQIPLTAAEYTPLQAPIPTLRLFSCRLLINDVYLSQCTRICVNRFFIAYQTS